MSHKFKVFGRNKLKVIIVSSVFLASFFFTVQPAVASNWYGATSSTSWCNGNMQDNSTLTFHRTSGLSTFYMYGSVASVINNKVNPTDLSVVAELSSPNTTTDIVYYEANYSGAIATCGTTAWYWSGSTGIPAGSASAIGWTKCQNLSGSKCDRFDIYFDQSWSINASQNYRNNIACHETGHALGLKHDSNTSCTNTTTPEGYSSHEVTDHINANY